MHRYSNGTAKGSLYVVATPIGNLRDISLRALDVLGSVDMIAAEDTRTTAKLLAHYSIDTKLMPLHEHNERKAASKVMALLASGKSVAVVSEAGTPGVSDPGAIVVSEARSRGFSVVPVPGSNAALCALSAAGWEAPHFLFYGFLPSKAAARRRELEKLESVPYPLIFYEAPHRILECVADLRTVLGEARQITLARELTKLFESIHACSLGGALEWLEQDPNRQKGEFVLLVSGAQARPSGETSEDAVRVLKLLMAELPLKQAVKLTVGITGEGRNAIYDRALNLAGKRGSGEG